MGFKIKRKTYLLEFEDPEFEGLMVEVRSAPLGQFIDMTKMAQLAEEKDETAAANATVKLFESFSNALVTWNLEDEDDNPVPATFEGLQTLDVDAAMYLIQSWMTAIGGVNTPLGSASTAGATSLEASIDVQAN